MYSYVIFTTPLELNFSKGSYTDQTNIYPTYLDELQTYGLCKSYFLSGYASVLDALDRTDESYREPRTDTRRKQALRKAAARAWIM